MALANLLQFQRDCLQLMEETDAGASSSIGQAKVVGQANSDPASGTAAAVLSSPPAECDTRTDDEEDVWLKAVLQQNIHELQNLRTKLSEPAVACVAEDETLEHTSAGDDTASTSPEKHNTDRAAISLECLQQLPLEYRQVLRFRFWEQMPIAQIAAATGDTAEYTATVLYRAVEALDDVCSRQRH
ncbi:MAG: sigma factor-like helix-turn-helix DNA-binding protein [Fuerstiella sp.]